MCQAKPYDGQPQYLLRNRPQDQVCPACEQYKPGWPDDWQNRPSEAGGLRYVCKSCSERLPAPPGRDSPLLKRIEDLRDMLELILPLAKGYAYDHRVGNNLEHIQLAERLLEEERQR